MAKLWGGYLVIWSARMPPSSSTWAPSGKTLAPIIFRYWPTVWRYGTTPTGLSRPDSRRSSGWGTASGSASRASRWYWASASARSSHFSFKAVVRRRKAPFSRSRVSCTPPNSLFRENLIMASSCGFPLPLLEVIVLQVFPEARVVLGLAGLGPLCGQLRRPYASLLEGSLLGDRLEEVQEGGSGRLPLQLQPLDFGGASRSWSAGPLCPWPEPWRPDAVAGHSIVS